MWVCTNRGFLSIVANRNNPDQLLVRARAKGHIEALFPGVKSEHTPDADYAYRVMLPRSRVTAFLRQEAENIEYDNFKNSVDDRALHDAYFAVWRAMHGYQFEQQDQPHPPKKSGVKRSKAVYTNPCTEDSGAIARPPRK